MDDRPNLTVRQKEILDYLCLGSTNQEISSYLAISVNTVKTHVAAVYKELGVGNRTEAVHRYRKLFPPLESPSLPQPSGLAILPFTASRDDDDVLSASRLTDAVTARMWGWQRFPVIAVDVCAQFRADDVARLFRERGARYAVVGDLYRDGERLRLDLRLLVAASGRVCWAQTFDLHGAPDGEALDAGSAHISAVLMPELLKAEFARTGLLASSELSPWEKTVRGLHLLEVRTWDNCRHALELFESALAQAPDLALAHYAYAHGNYKKVLEQWGGDFDDAAARVREHARRCAVLEPSGADGCLAVALSRLLEGRNDEAVRLLLEAVRINPCLAVGFNLLGQLHAMQGHPEDGLRYLQESARLSVHTAAYSHNQGALAMFHFASGNYAGAVAACREGLNYDLGYLLLHALLVASCSLGGNVPEAARAYARLRALRPDFTPEATFPVLRNVSEQQRGLFLKGLRDAAGT
jgi:adenylate cyclase